jgi:alkylation response protein AidB-like acyl-CoA dehydrogenase
VDFQLTEDQKALRDTLRDFLEGTCPIDKLPELAKDTRLDRDLWASVAEMGVFGLRLPESEGGVGLGNADAVLVFTELGRRLVPGPLAWTHLAAGFIDGAAAGETIVGGLDLCGADAGEPYLVEHLDSLDVLLLLKPDGVFRVDPGSLSGTPVETPLDPLTPLTHVRDLPAGERILDAAAAAQLRLEGAALVSGQLLGIAEATLELANAYAKERHQFDRPIGGFQAVKHILADMFVRQEVSRAAAYSAGATLDAPDVASVERAVAAAKVTCSEAGLRNSRSCIQVHGGMGYTWEVPAHYYMKRTWVLGEVFGNEDEYALRSADLIGAEA